MQWRIWSVAGEALNFGGRRMETILRLAWLPIILLLIVQLVSVLMTLSIAFERDISLNGQVSYRAALAAYPQSAAAAWQLKPVQMVMISAVSFGMSLLLVSSFMTPLIRYAASGEKPAPGLFRLPFGLEQIRFAVSSLIGGLVTSVVLFAPLALMMTAVSKHIFRTVAQTSIKGQVTFPTEQSLHSVFETRFNEILSGSAKWWVSGLPLSLTWGSAILGTIFLALMINHFHPRNRRLAVDSTPKPLLRIPVVIILSVAFIGLFWGWAIGLIPKIPFIMSALPTFAKSQASFGIFCILALAVFYYLSLRLFAWPGHTVMEQKFLSSEVLRASRGWNLFRMVGLVFLILVVAVFMQLIINIAINQILLIAVQYTTTLVVTVTRMLNFGYNVDWVLPVARWFWTGAGLLVNIFWMLFSYGVLAGLYGRLYAHIHASKPYLPL